VNGDIGLGAASPRGNSIQMEARLKMSRVGCAAIAITFGATGAHGQESSCLYNTEGPAVAQIVYSYKKSDEGSPLQGTGVLVSSKGYILTAAHVVSPENGDKVIVESIVVRLGSLGANPVNAIIVRRDPDLDLALLKIPESAASVTPAPIGQSSALTVGDLLTGIGFPNSDLAIVPRQQITAKNTFVHGVLKPWWQTSLALNHGNSGGPVFSKLGTVVGIAVSMLEGTQQISYVIPIQYAGPLLDQAGVNMVPAGPCAELPVCRTASNGIEGYTVDQQIPGDSGWRGGGYNQNAFCNDRKTALQNAYPHSVLTETGRSENSHKDTWGHVTYIYYCSFHRQEGPIYKSMASLDCIDKIH